MEQWLKELDLAPKTKGHLQNLMRLLVNCAMRWELVDIGANPLKLVRVRGGSKRTMEPKVLTIPQFQQLVKELNDPYRTMVLLDLATGLHCSELFALKWCDVIWDDLTLLVRRAIVDTVESDVKTVYSRAGMPLDPALADVLLNWQRTSELNKPEDWIFASPYKAGKKPRHRPHRLAHIPPHLPESFGRDWGSAQSAAGINAPCRHTNHHEHLRKSHGDEQARGTWQSRSPRSAFKRGLVPPYCPRGFLSRWKKRKFW